MKLIFILLFIFSELTLLAQYKIGFYTNNWEKTDQAGAYYRIEKIIKNDDTVKYYILKTDEIDSAVYNGCLIHAKKEKNYYNFKMYYPDGKLKESGYYFNKTRDGK